MVVVWNLYMASLAPLVAAAGSGLPVVVHVCDKWLYFGSYDLAPMLQATVAWKRAALSLARRTVQPMLRRLAPPRRLVAISHFMKAFYVAGRVSRPSRSTSSTSASPPTSFTFVPRAPRSAGDPLTLLFVGSLWEGKGPQTAVRALGRLLRSGVRAHLDVCGSGASPSSWSSFAGVIAEEGVADHVTLHGRVDRDAVRRLCQSHDVLVFPSQWDEPFAAVPGRGDEQRHGRGGHHRRGHAGGDRRRRDGPARSSRRSGRAGPRALPAGRGRRAADRGSARARRASRASASTSTAYVDRLEALLPGLASPTGR